MKTKFLLAILTLVLLSMTVSAIENLTIPSKEGTFRKSVNSVEFTLSNSGANDLSLSFSSPVRISGENGYILPVSLKDTAGNTITSPLTVVRSSSMKLVAEVTDPEWSNFKLGDEYSTPLVLTGTTGNETLTLSFVNGFCKSGDFGELEITDFEDKEKDNEDPWDWQPLNNVEFEVEVYNGFEDDKRVNVEYEVYKDGKKVEFDNEDTEQSVSIDSGDSETVTFSLVVPADIDDGEYKLFVKAYVKGRESEVTNIDAGCIDHSSILESEYYQKLSIIRDEGRAIVVDMDTVTPLDSVKCGDTVTLYAKIYNIGTEDEDKVKVNLYNKELGIDLDEVLNGLDEGDSATLTFNFKIPENVDGKSYTFKLTTFYEFDEDNDEYESNSKDELDEDFDFGLNVVCTKTEPTKADASITAELDSDATAGGELKIKGTLNNTGEEETTYTISVADYEEWAELGKVTPSTFTLEVGESKDFSITLNVNEDAEDEQSLTIEASYGGETTDQEVSVVIEGKGTGAGITGAAIGTHFKENWFIWVIIAINIVLIIAIIVVARRIVTAR